MALISSNTPNTDDSAASRHSRGIRSRRGQTLIVFALVMPLLIAILGLVFDGGRLYYEKRKMQLAADAGAKSAAHEIRQGRKGTAWVESAAFDDTKLNGYDNDLSTVTVTMNNPPATGGYDDQFAEVIIDNTVNTTFMMLFGKSTADVRARAVAGVIADPAPACILALNPDMRGALTISGGAVLEADCLVMVNSKDPRSIIQNGTGACIYAASIGYVYEGGAVVNGSASCLNPEPEGSAIPGEDTYEYMAEPDPADYPIRSTSKLVLGNGTHYLEAGYYQGGIQVTATDAIVILGEGMFVVDGMSMSGGTISGDNVTLYNTAQGTSMKSISITGGTEINLTAPKDGYYENMLVFNSRSAPNTNLYQIKMVGTSSSIFEGVIYAPTTKVDFGGNETTTATWAMIIADNIEFHGTPNIGVSGIAADTSGRTSNAVRVSIVE